MLQKHPVFTHTAFTGWPFLRICAVHCEVRTQSLYTTYDIYNQHRCAASQVVSLWPFTADAHVRFQVTPREICGEQTGIGTRFSASTSVFRIISPMLRIHHPLHVARTTGINRRNLGNFPEAMAFRKCGGKFVGSKVF